MGLSGPIIQTEDLTRQFGATVAVDALDLSIAPGEVFGFLGHNGAGKTTTVRLLNGVLTPTRGRARVFGLDPATHGARVRAHTGVLTETPALDDRMTARAALRYFATVFGVPRAEVDRRVRQLLETFDLAERADDKVGSFSKGMRQRLALARTLIHDPQIVFLDEPTAALDPVATREVHRMIEQLSRSGRTVFLATHNLAEAERLCDRVAVLAHGRVLAAGTVRELGAHLNRGHRLVVEFAADQVEEAAHLLARIPPVAAVERLDGQHGADPGAVWLSLHGIGRDAVPDVLGALVAAGIRVYRVEPDEPSLEDVYFALQQEPA